MLVRVRVLVLALIQAKCGVEMAERDLELLLNSMDPVRAARLTPCRPPLSSSLLALEQRTTVGKRAARTFEKPCVTSVWTLLYFFRFEKKKKKKRR